MEIGSFEHRSLKRLFEDDDASKLDAAVAGKLRLILAFLQDMGSIEELTAPPKWKAYPLTGTARGRGACS
jgi:toxin HigB-1